MSSILEQFPVEAQMGLSNLEKACQLFNNFRIYYVVRITVNSLVPHFWITFRLWQYHKQKSCKIGNFYSKILSFYEPTVKKGKIICCPKLNNSKLFRDHGKFGTGRAKLPKFLKLYYIFIMKDLHMHYFRIFQ